MSFRNVIEELVIQEAEKQVKRLGAAAQEQIDLSAAIAYALNRLPPLYATTQRGWTQQHKRAHSEYGSQIAHVVKQALLGVHRDPLHSSAPLPPDEGMTRARALVKLQELLRHPDLKWKQVPAAVESALRDARLAGRVSAPGGFSRRSALGIKAYLRRTRMSDLGQPSGDISRQTLRAASEEKEFQAYMAGAAYSYSNILENLVLAVSERKLSRLPPTLAQQIDIDEVAAYTLNRLPPMYATSRHGYKVLRLQVKMSMTNQISSLVRQAIVKIAESPVRLLPPLPLAKFDVEQEVALDQLRHILEREDVSWRNVAAVVKEAIEQAKQQGATEQPEGKQPDTSAPQIAGI